MRFLRFVQQSSVLVWLCLVVPNMASAAFESGSTGADGAFEPTVSVERQIPDSGVFNFTTVNIPTGVTITFKKNAKNTPVTILATGDVTINGTISVSGSDGNFIIGGAGGPGGFGGGLGGSASQSGKRGEGPGGGGGGIAKPDVNYGAGGGAGAGFASNGTNGNNGYSGSAGGTGGVVYGNEKILPSIGGSGGGGAGGNNTWVGGAGGGGAGALVIASSGTITVNGTIRANGGNGATPSTGQSNYSGGGGGSGGSIRLIANTISGNGSITANGGAGGGSNYGGNGGTGSVGRIRFEASNVLRTAATSPSMSLGYAYAVTPPNMPTLTITSIGGQSVPLVPSGSFGTPDVMLPYNTTNPVTIVVSGVNIPTGTTVTLKALPSVGNATSTSGTLSGSDSSSSVSLGLNIASAYPSIITASVTFQLAALNGGAPVFAAGEKVKFVRVAANLGGKSSMTYITESGKEVPVVM